MDPRPAACLLFGACALLFAGCNDRDNARAIDPWDLTGEILGEQNSLASQFGDEPDQPPVATRLVFYSMPDDWAVYKYPPRLHEDVDDFVIYDPENKIVVDVLDQYGKRFQDWSGTMTVSLSTNPTGTTLWGTTTVDSSWDRWIPSGVIRTSWYGNGRAVFGLSMSDPGVGYVLTARASGLAPVQSVPFSASRKVSERWGLKFAVQPRIIGPANADGYYPLNEVQIEAIDHYGFRYEDAPAGILTLDPRFGYLRGTRSQPRIDGVTTFPDLLFKFQGIGTDDCLYVFDDYYGLLFSSDSFLRP